MTPSPALAETIELLYETGWTDGLPVVPPTGDLVERFIRASDRPADELIAELPPLGGRATVERIAVNAVMAGCLPEYMPVVITAVQALMDDRFNLRGVQCSTGIHCPLVIVNGPIVKQLDINSGYNCFGQGWRANATIGRAFRFILQNIGGAIPGDTDRSTFGHQGKFSSCIGENEEASPWPPLHVERGLEGSDSAVTVIAVDPHIMVNDASSTVGEGVLHSIASTMIQAGSNNALFGGEIVVILGPEHVDMLVRDGWDPSRIRAFLYERGRVPLSFFSPENLERVRGRRGEIFAREDLKSVPVADDAESICMFVAGGLGKHSLVIPTFGHTHSVTRKIAFSFTD
mgnify:CR=1 FL=1